MFQVNIAAPVPTVDSYLMTGGSDCTFDQVAPAPALGAGTNDVALTAPAPKVTSTLVQITVDAALYMPAPTLAATVLTGEIISFSNAAPLPIAEFGSDDFAQTAPAPVLAATLLSGTIITVSALAAVPVLVAVLDNPTIITADNSAPAPQLAAAMAAGQIMEAALLASVPTLSAMLLTGNVGTMELTAATPIMEAAGYPAYTISFAGEAPAPYLTSELSAALLENYRTWVLNTRKSPLTEYSNFAFNSYAVFNGKVIAAGASGLVELGLQDDDAGTAIASTATLGEESFGSSLHKRVPRIYLGHAATGDLRFSTITVEGGTRTYALDWNGVTGTQQRRVPVGKGPRSRFWSFSVSNVEGSDFEINDVLVMPTKLRRRVE